MSAKASTEISWRAGILPCAPLFLKGEKLGKGPSCNSGKDLKGDGGGLLCSYPRKIDSGRFPESKLLPASSLHMRGSGKRGHLLGLPLQKAFHHWSQDQKPSQRRKTGKEEQNHCSSQALKGRKIEPFLLNPVLSLQPDKIPPSCALK
ncbi:MAG: hypothetical protein QHH21_01095 [Caldisericota bacterium]|nr:hypothetical protein [Caldisericota bacterium]